MDRTVPKREDLDRGIDPGQRSAGSRLSGLSDNSRSTSQPFTTRDRSKISSRIVSFLPHMAPSAGMSFPEEEYERLIACLSSDVLPYAGCLTQYDPEPLAWIDFVAIGLGLVDTDCIATGVGVKLRDIVSKKCKILPNTSGPERSHCDLGAKNASFSFVTGSTRCETCVMRHCSRTIENAGDIDLLILDIPDEFDVIAGDLERFSVRYFSFFG